MKYWLSVLFLIFSLGLSAQNADRIRISLLTCSPGEELYSTFGHSALRIIDSNNVSDLVYNYGTFDFSDPDFYTKFIRGKLMYYLSLERYEDFAWAYQTDNRAITEQVLNLSPEEKQAFKEAMNQNLQPENRAYRYDFCLDNCTTRLLDKIEAYKQPEPVLPFVMPEGYTFRNAIHHYLDLNKKDWSKLGIDLLLGARTDAVMTARQQMFLPDNLLLGLNKSSVPVVQSQALIIPNQPKPESPFRVTPMMVSLLLLCIGVFASLSKRSGIKKFYRFYRYLLFVFAGLLGCLLLFMWWGTDHNMTKNNYNLLWALPTHLVFAFMFRSASKAVKYYFLISAIFSAICLLLFPFWPQQLNVALIPLIALLGWMAFRAWHSPEKD